MKPGLLLPIDQSFTKDQSNRFVIAAGDRPPGYERVEAQTGQVPCDSGGMANQGARTETAGEATVNLQALALGAHGCHPAESWAEDGETTPPASDLPSPGLGDESIPGIKRVDARLNLSGSSSSSIDEFWRVRNVAVVLSSGHLFGASDEDVLRMARNMSDRAVR